MSKQYGLLCTKCGEDTDCYPDLTRMSAAHAIALVSDWMCADCLDDLDEASATEAITKNRERLTQPEAWCRCPGPDEHNKPGAQHRAPSLSLQRGRKGER